MARRKRMHGKRRRCSALKKRISIGSKTYDDLNPEMRRAVEGQPGMPTQEQLEAEKKEKDDPGVQNISF